MALSIKLRKMLHRKGIEYCSQLRAGNTAAGSFIVSDKSDVVPGRDCMIYVGGASTIYNYNADEDAWLALKPSGIAGTFAAGSCGEFRGISAPAGVITNTATAGTTTTITTSLTLNRDISGVKIRIVDGAGVGYVGEVLSNTKGANAVLTLRVASAIAFGATTKYQLFGGSLWFFNAGTTAVGFSVWDRITDTWTARSVTGLPTAWGTDAQLVSTPSISSNCGNMLYATGTATSAGSTSLTDTGNTFPVNAFCSFFYVEITSGTGKGQRRKIVSNTSDTIVVDAAWAITPDATSQYKIGGAGFLIGSCSSATGTTLVDSSKTNLPVNGFVNYQIRIYAGTGAGQIRTITASTATGTFTVAAWTVTPDTTSKYVIEGNDDFMYLLGNNAVTAYKYTVSANAWATLSPTAARSGAYAAGGTADWIDAVSEWNDQSFTHQYSNTLFKQNGRYIYSFRGGATSTLDVFDLAAVTWISGVPYGNQAETFTTGSCAVDKHGKIFIQKEATGAIFRFDVAKQLMEPCIQSVVPQGTVVVGDKIAIGTFTEDNQSLDYLYALSNTSSIFVRWLLI